MNDARAVALKLGAISVTPLGIFAAARLARFLSKGGQRGALGCFHLLARFPAAFGNACHGRRLLAHAAISRRLRTLSRAQIVSGLSILASPESASAQISRAKFVPLCGPPISPSANRKLQAASPSPPPTRRSTRTK